jgi:hypothetical protein
MAALDLLDAIALASRLHAGDGRRRGIIDAKDDAHVQVDVTAHAVLVFEFDHSNEVGREVGH